MLQAGDCKDLVHSLCIAASAAAAAAATAAAAYMRLASPGHQAPSRVVALSLPSSGWYHHHHHHHVTH
jgi:hypothetical protein